jgi:5,6,7,8-tetrahydromethanopterin hydro-lyase
MELCPPIWNHWLIWSAAGRLTSYNIHPMQGQKIQIGESFVGEGAEAAHINTVLGYREGPVGTAWATALAAPRQGHVPFLAVLRPNLPVKPLTLFVNKAPIDGDLHADLTWGAAQAGVAGGVADAVADGVITAVDADQLVLIAAVWVNPKATDPDLVYANNRAATRQALENGRNGTPSVDEMLAHRDHPHNPFFSGSIARLTSPERVDRAIDPDDDRAEE